MKPSRVDLWAVAVLWVGLVRLVLPADVEPVVAELVEVADVQYKPPETRRPVSETRASEVER